MGSKNLKAIAVRGNKKIPIAHPELFQQERNKWREIIKGNPMSRFMGEYGGTGDLEQEDKMGILPIRNFEQTSGFSGVENLSAEAMKKYYTKSISCFACPVHCIQCYEVKDGPYRGTKGAKLPEGCTSPCGPGCGNTDLSSLFKIQNLANEYGIDIIEYGTGMAIAMDWYEHGIIDKEVTGGIPLNWGNHQSIIDMIPKVARREGFGGLMAEGIVNASRKLGKKAEEYVSSCKGMVFYGVDPRVTKGYALCFATSTRGADHLRGGMMVEIIPSISPEEAKKRFGSKDVLVPTSYEKAKAVNFYQDIYTIADVLEICKFITLGPGITLENMTDMLYAVTGVKLDTDEIRTVADRIFTLERAFLVRQGITKQDDFLQGKWVKGPVPSGPFKGHTIENKKWTKMLEEYYEYRGWDIMSGIPTQETLKRLGLHDVAKDLN